MRNAMFMAVGIIIGALLTIPMMKENPWRQIKRYQMYVGDPSNLREDRSSGFKYLDGREIPKIDSALGSLVDNGEVSYATFVIPGARSRDNIARWKQEDTFLLAVGPAHIDGIYPAATNDLVFTAWFKACDYEKVIDFVRTIYQESISNSVQQANAQDALTGAGDQ